MTIFTSTKWFCNACGQEQFSPIALLAIGRNFKCCSEACLKEMNLREICSNMGRPYGSLHNPHDKDL